jgi:NAD-dependent dihydropyrimidine dehydrogenase PreA subunit
MQIGTTMRRTLATLLLSAGLAYPACAAVCPKGIGGCSSPGRCFLFTDADGNSLCDYTARSGTSTAAPAQTTAPSPSASNVTPATAPVAPSSASAPGAASLPPSPGTGTSTVQGATGTGLFDMLRTFAIPAGVLLFVFLTGAFYYGIRKGTGGIRVEKAGPALALSSLFALGISLMASCLLAAGEIHGMVFALVYIGAGTLLTAYLWHTGVMSRRIAVALAVQSTLAGFVFLAPIMPLEFGSLVNILTGVSALTPGILIICGVIALAIVAGRTFCAHICPAGSLQELAYAVPVNKIDIRRTEIPELIRLVIFVATIGGAICLVDLMAWTGLFELFSLTLSAVLVVAVALVLLSVVLYRPVCRFICPFGVLFSLLAEFSIFRLRRTDSCIRCRKCEKACPTQSAGATDSRRECYLCARCTGACPAGSALVYDKEERPGREPVKQNAPEGEHTNG